MTSSTKETVSAMNKFIIVLAAIAPWRKKYKNEGFQEVIECPACKGRLHLSIAACNGHVWGRCETPDCVKWME